MCLDWEYRRSRIVVIPTQWSGLKAFAFFLDVDRYIVVGVFVVVVVVVVVKIVVVVVVDCVMVVVVVILVVMGVGGIWAPRDG